jgi:hypothetical protein
MSFLGHDVRKVEHSRHRVVIEATPSIPIIALFGAMAVLVVALTATAPKKPAIDYCIPVVAMVFFASFALNGSVRSTLTADRTAGQLIIARTLLFWTFTQTYESYLIDRVYVRDTQKGSALRVRFKSGRTRRLTLWYDFRTEPLQQAALALNEGLPHRA